MSVSVVPIPLSSPHFPLPSDYNELTREGQRLARVNAARQWLVSCSPQEHRVRAIASHNFFDLAYLHPTDNDNPGFYDENPLPKPPFHDQMVGDWHSYRMTGQQFPRGSAKSTTCRRDMIHRSVTCPNYSFVYATSTDVLATLSNGIVKNQCYTNPRINDDFGPEPEFGGQIKPNRGDRATGVELFYLSNGSWCRAMSASSRQRGMRPRRYRLDDPEYDPSASTSMTMLREWVEELLFKLVIPMVLRQGCGVDWIGTFITKRHYLWHALSTKAVIENGVTVHRALDPRFDYWARTSMHAGRETTLTEADGVTPVYESAWPHMWPGSLQEKLDLGLPADILTLGQLRDAIGVHVFNPEYMGKPDDTGTAYFPPLTQELHGFTILNDDGLVQSDPRHSSALLCWKRRTREGTFESVSMPLSEFLSRARLFMCLDHADTSHADSDYKTIALMAHLPSDNELFVLDLYASKKDRSDQVKTAFEWADRWRCPTVHPEVVKAGVTLFNDLQDKARTRAMDTTGNAFVPKIVALRPGMEEKVSKISSLSHRIEHGLLKLPFNLKSRSPWSELFAQFEEFNPYAPNGGLAKDDHIDTVAMEGRVLKTARRVYVDPTAPKEEDANALLAKGLNLVDGVPIASGMNIQDISPANLSRLLDTYSPLTEENRI